jgi:hypothetical protein
VDLDAQRVQLAARRRELEMSGAPCDEAAANAILEPAQRTADGRLAEEKPLGGARETALLRDNEKG